jgi:hypothetical protein
VIPQWLGVFDASMSSNSRPTSSPSSIAAAESAEAQRSATAEVARQANQTATAEVLNNLVMRTATAAAREAAAEDATTTTLRETTHAIGSSEVPSETPLPPTAQLEPTNTFSVCSNELLTRGFGKLYKDNVGVRMGLGCPLEHEIAANSVVQFYERGAMYWWEPSDTIYVFLENEQNNYQIFTHEEVARMPEPPSTSSDPNMPVRGFGRIYYGLPQIQSALGEPYTPEIILEPHGVKQRFENGLMFWIPPATDPRETRKQILVLYHNGAFNLYNDTYEE